MQLLSQDVRNERETVLAWPAVHLFLQSGIISCRHGKRLQGAGGAPEGSVQVLIPGQQWHHPISRLPLLAISALQMGQHKNSLGFQEHLV